MGNNRGMEKLLAYLNALPKDEREGWCRRCGTSEGYVRKAISTGAKFGPELCIAFERESGRTVTCEDVRPEVDWSYLRSSALKPAKPRVAA